MNVPDITRTVEAHVPFSGPMLTQLRRDVLPHIRGLQRAGQLQWYCFLLHEARCLKGHDPDDKTLVIHLRLEPSVGLSPEAFIAGLPAAFKEPQLLPLDGIGELDLTMLQDHVWANGWRMVGEASEWVLSLLESCDAGLEPATAVRFLHYVTNGLGIGNSCIWIASGARF